MKILGWKLENILNCCSYSGEKKNSVDNLGLLKCYEYAGSSHHFASIMRLINIKKKNVIID